ncbi:hypothetical protein OAI11_00810 [Rhodospirillales bacterium]|nr:hypothetical protein [Rhodospirillales bacterium]
MKSITETRGRAPRSRKVEGSGKKKGSIVTQTNEVKEAVLRVFNDLNAADEYLQEIAKSDTRLFLSLLAKLIPQSTEVSIDHRVTVDMGAAIREAEARIAAAPKIIEHDPTPTLTPDTVELSRVPSDVSPTPKNEWPGY